MEKGLHPLHYGVYLGNMFASPSQFAIAQAGLMKPSELLFHLVEIPETQFDPKGLENLRNILVQRVGDGDLTSIVPTSDGFLGSCSDKETVSLKVRSKSDASVYDVTIYSPFFDSPESLSSFKVIGGTKHSTKTLARNMHWSKGLQHERHFVSNLADVVSSVSREAVFRDYEPRTVLIDSAIATGLLALRNPDEFRNGSSERRDVIVPYSFSIPNLLKILARLTRENQANVDRDHISDLNGFGKESFSEGLITKGAFLKNKVMPGQAWAIIQGLEEVCYRHGFRYAQQYSIEFPGTEFETIASVFNNGENSVRIIFDEKSQMPYMLFKRPSSGRLSILENPYAFLNPGRGRTKIKTQHWFEEDMHTGKRMRCSLYEPSSIARDYAKKHSLAAGRELNLANVASNYKKAWQIHRG
jgi:hypothetical protein